MEANQISSIYRTNTDLGLSGVDCTETQSVVYAASLLGAHDLKPADNQGANSFTLICPSLLKVVQFRLRAFKDDILDLAHKIYGEDIPLAIPQPGFVLPVYISNVIPGLVHVLQPFPKGTFPLARQERTVCDLARFIGKATFFPQPGDTLLSSSWTAQAGTTIDRLLKSKMLEEVCPELLPLLTEVKADISLLHSLPLVLTHHDLAEMNVFVDAEGHVTGVIDFDEAGIEAFGMCIWGIYECWLGMMEDGKFSFYLQTTADSGAKTVKDVLEERFWQVLWQSVSPGLGLADKKDAVRVAVVIGVVNRYFVNGMLDHIDIQAQNHARSLEYARGILLGLRVL